MRDKKTSFIGYLAFVMLYKNSHFVLYKNLSSHNELWKLICNFNAMDVHYLSKFWTKKTAVFLLSYTLGKLRHFGEDFFEILL